jgi:hypothetical protein
LGWSTSEKLALSIRPLLSNPRRVVRQHKECHAGSSFRIGRVFNTLKDYPAGSASAARYCCVKILRLRGKNTKFAREHYRSTVRDQRLGELGGWQPGPKLLRMETQEQPECLIGPRLPLAYLSI